MLNEVSVLNFYLEQMEKGNVQFLKDRKAYSDEIRDHVIELRDAESMNQKINAAKGLWKALFEAAMTYIDPDKRGYDRLFKFFDEYVNFEELIFASDSFYRDHTLHCLWVYFLGEYIYRNEEFRLIYNKMNLPYEKQRNIRDIMKSFEMDDIFGNAIKAYDEILSLPKFEDSIRCITAITHDLGYPLKKIDKINKCIKNVLPYFCINDYDEFNFSYSSIEQNFISNFIEFLSNSINITDTASNTSSDQQVYEDIIQRILILDAGHSIIGINKDEIKNCSKDELTKVKEMLYLKYQVYKNTAKLWNYNNDFEGYKHGIMSAFLLIKNIKAFNKIKLIYSTNENIEMHYINYPDVTSKQTILRAITDHTCDDFRITDINGASAFLTFIDELEEFSRISRANQNREFISEFCSTNIYMKDEYINIDFTFDNTEIENLDPERAFKGRCERFLGLFDITNLAPDLKIKLRCIGKLSYDDNIYELEIRRKFAKISINNEEKDIPRYLKSKQFYSREEYANI